jgi:hypothetical protein
MHVLLFCTCAIQLTANPPRSDVCVQERRRKLAIKEPEKYNFKPR